VLATNCDASSTAISHASSAGNPVSPSRRSLASPTSPIGPSYIRTATPVPSSADQSEYCSVQATVISRVPAVNWLFSNVSRSLKNALVPSPAPADAIPILPARRGPSVS
jgi:hypothetical protein